MRRPALLVVALTLAGCGGDDGSGERPQLTVAAATSLGEALTRYAREFAAADVKLSFAGSDAIAAQIREGVEPDIFVSADVRLLEGVGGEPVPVATNRLVVAIPAEEPKVRTFADLAREDVTIAMGNATVPIGAYAQEALARLPAEHRRRILDNVRSGEPDAAGVVGKVASGAVDAGFVYTTDVRAADEDVLELAIPDGIQPRIEYAGVVLGGGDVAQRFLEGLASAPAMRDAGFGPP